MTKKKINIIAVFIVLSLISVVVLNDILRVKECEALSGRLPSPTKVLECSQYSDLPEFVGLRLNAHNPLKVDFLLENNEKVHSKEHINLLVEFFLSAITIPKEKFWVNLSPYEADRVIDDSLLMTQSGRLFLEQDYLLKILTASLTHPNTKYGNEYWNSKMNTQGSVNESSSDVLRKIWIVPELAKVSVVNNAVIIDESLLRVESEKNAFGTESDKQLLKSTIEDQINNGEHFALLRSFYKSFLLGLWYKDMLKSSVMDGYIDKAKLKGIDFDNKEIKQTVYKQYMKSNKLGVYDISVQTHKDNLKRRYIAGGFGLNKTQYQSTACSPIEALNKTRELGPLEQVSVKLDQLGLNNLSNEITDNKARKARPLQVVIELENLISELIEQKTFASENYQDYLLKLLSYIKTSRGHIANALYRSDIEDGLVRLSYIRWGKDVNLPQEVQKKYLKDSLAYFVDEVMKIDPQSIGLMGQLANEEEIINKTDESLDNDSAEEIKSEDILELATDTVENVAKDNDEGIEDEQEKQNFLDSVYLKFINFIELSRTQVLKLLSSIQNMFISATMIVSYLLKKIIKTRIKRILLPNKTIIGIPIQPMVVMSAITSIISALFGVHYLAIGSMLFILALQFFGKAEGGSQDFQRESTLNQSPFLSALLGESDGWSNSNEKKPFAVSMSGELDGKLLYMGNGEYSNFKKKSDTFFTQASNDDLINSLVYIDGVAPLVPELNLHVENTDFIRSIRDFRERNKITRLRNIRVDYLLSSLERRNNEYRLPSPVVDNDYLLIPYGVLDQDAVNYHFKPSGLWVSGIDDELEKVSFNYYVFPAYFADGQFREEFAKFKSQYSFIFSLSNQSEFSFSKSSMLEDLERYIKANDEFKSRIEVKEYSIEQMDNRSRRYELPLEKSDEHIFIPLRVQDKKNINFTVSKEKLYVNNDEMPVIDADEDKIRVTYLKVDRSFLNTNWELFDKYGKEIDALLGNFPSHPVYEYQHEKESTNFDNYDLGPVFEGKIEQWKNSGIPDHLLVKEIKEFMQSYFFYGQGFKDFLKIFLAKGKAAYQKTINSRRGVCYDANKVAFIVLQKLGIQTKFVEGYRSSEGGTISSTGHAFLKYWSREKERWLVADMTPEKKSYLESELYSNVIYDSNDKFLDSISITKDCFKLSANSLSSEYKNYIDPRFIMPKFYSIAEEIGHKVTYDLKGLDSNQPIMLPNALTANEGVYTLPVSTNNGKLVYDEYGRLYLDTSDDDFYDNASIEYLLVSKEEYEKHFVFKELFRYNQKYFSAGRSLDSELLNKKGIYGKDVENFIGNLLTTTLSDSELIKEIKDYINLNFEYFEVKEYMKNNPRTIRRPDHIFAYIANSVGIPTRFKTDIAFESDDFLKDVVFGDRISKNYDYYNEQEGKWENGRLTLLKGEENEKFREKYLLDKFVKDDPEASLLQAEIEAEEAWLGQRIFSESDFEFHILPSGYWLRDDTDIKSYKNVLKLKLELLKVTKRHYIKSGALQLENKLMDIFGKISEENTEAILRAIGINTQDIKRKYVVTKDKKGWTSLKRIVELEFLLKTCFEPVSSRGIFNPTQYDYKIALFEKKGFDVPGERYEYEITDYPVVVSKYESILKDHLTEFTYYDLLSADLKGLENNKDSLDYLFDFLNDYRRGTNSRLFVSEEGKFSEALLDKMNKLFKTRQIIDKEIYSQKVGAFVRDDEIDDMEAIREYEKKKYDRKISASSSVGGIDLSDAMYTSQNQIAIHFDKSIQLKDGFTGFKYKIMNKEKIREAHDLVWFFS